MTSGTNLFDNPLAGWANDDILLSGATQTKFAALAPSALPIFDWPELRSRFSRYDNIANPARRASRRGGTRAAFVGYASLIVAALTPLLTTDITSPVARALGIAAAALAVAATIWGYAQLLIGRRKREWLDARFLTERLRQMHFQFILANLDLAVAVVCDQARLPEWNMRRTAALAAFDLNIAEPVAASFQAMRTDLEEAEFWVIPGWRKRSALPSPSPELDLIFDVFANQRFGIQQRFAELKTLPNIHSPTSRAATHRAISDLLTLLVLVTTTGGGLLLAFGGDPNGSGAKVVAAIVALTTATIVLLRVFNEGLQLAQEAERYRWYYAAVKALASRFERAGDRGKVELARDMERLSYQEMRWFLNAFADSRFVM